MRLKNLFLFGAALAVVASCDDDTSSVGTGMMPGDDGITTHTASFTLKSHTEEIDSVLANTNTCMLGAIIDPETRAMTKCDFLAQFHVMENYAFPEKDVMLEDVDGGVLIDSCDLRIYFDTFYGDSLTPMVLRVHELDTMRVMEEDDVFYTSLNPSDYINHNSSIKDTLVYAVCDMARDTLSSVSSSNYYRSIKVTLPKEYGKYLANKYYENKDNYKNSYNFIHNVCPGFYFETAGGVGSMIKVKVSALNVYFRYKTVNSLGNDTIVDGMQRMAATEEVIQNTRIENSIPLELLNSDTCTYVKSPASLYTVIELPVDDVFSAENAAPGDSVTSASLSIRRYNPVVTGNYVLPAPTLLLMLRKSEMEDFFKEGEIANGKDSYLASYDAVKNAYVFSNISRLLSICRDEKAQGDPEWNKVVLLPVRADYSTTTNYYGATTSTLLSVNHELGITSARLEGGNSDALKLSVVYSRFGE